MVRASALYISLIISILIVLVCGAMLMLGYTYKMHERKHLRMGRLKDNVIAGSKILLLNSFEAGSSKRLSLYGQGKDSVLLEKKSWGIYELGTVSSWIGTDTLRKTFLIGTALNDTLKVLEIADEDRPISISGKSLIKGKAYLPKSGIKAAYVGSSGYPDKMLVYGTIGNSDRQLPEPDERILKILGALLQPKEAEKVEPLPDSIVNSFFSPVRRLHLGKNNPKLSGFKARGSVIIASDSLVVVEANTCLDQVILVAPQVRIMDKFKGRLQVIASDSIRIGNSVELRYPSALLVLKNDTAKFQVRIAIGKNSSIAGQVFAWEKERSTLMPFISIGEGARVQGEVWCKGYVGLANGAEVQGSVSAIRLMARASGSIYENYLIDARLDKTALSRYYLSSGLLNRPAKRGGLLCWLK